MKKSELRRLIREEIKKLRKESNDKVIDAEYFVKTVKQIIKKQKRFFAKNELNYIDDLIELVHQKFPNQDITQEKLWRLTQKDNSLKGYINKIDVQKLLSNLWEFIKLS